MVSNVFFRCLLVVITDKINYDLQTDSNVSSGYICIRASTRL